MAITPFATEADWRMAIDTTLIYAHHELRLFDGDMQRIALEDVERIARLSAFLAADPDRRLRLVLIELDYLQRHCPRLLGLMRRCGHAIETRQCPAHLRHLAERYLLADGQHGAIRFHTDQPRGKLVLDEGGEIQPWWRRFDDLWLESEAVAPASTLGL